MTWQHENVFPLVRYLYKVLPHPYHTLEAKREAADMVRMLRPKEEAELHLSSSQTHSVNLRPHIPSSLSHLFSSSL